MRTKLFNVPTDLLVEFSEMLVDNELVNEIKGSTEDESIVIEVSYGSDQKGSIHDLTEWLEENIQVEDEVE
jgi:hypothetical protein